MGGWGRRAMAWVEADWIARRLAERRRRARRGDPDRPGPPRLCLCRPTRGG